MKKSLYILLSAVMILSGLSFAAFSETDPAEMQEEMDVSSILGVVCEPTDIIKTGDNEFLVTDAYNKVIYSVKDGETSIFAGEETAADLYGEPIGGYYDTNSRNSMFSHPWAITVFNNGYAVSDIANNCVRFISRDITKTITGNGTSGDKIGKGTEATFDRPTGLATDNRGDLYVADTGNGRICLVNHSTGEVSLILKELNEPTALCWKNGVLYICESGNNRIIKLQNGEVTTVAGSTVADMEDGTAENACFNNPMGIAVADNGTIFVSDTGNSAVRMIKDGQVTTILEQDAEELSQYPALPAGLLFSDDLLYVCDTYANKVYTISVDY